MSAPEHIVATRHIQRLIRNGLALAQVADGSGQMVLDDGVARCTIDVLEKAAADLRHAAEELTAERLSLLGWPQV